MSRGLSLMGATLTETMALFDDTLEAFRMPVSAPPRKRGTVVDGFVKTFQATGASPIPCLNVLRGDGNTYRPARFELAAGVSLAPYPFSAGWDEKWWGVRLGSGPLLSLYEAVGQGLAWEVAD